MISTFVVLNESCLLRCQSLGGGTIPEAVCRLRAGVDVDRMDTSEVLLLSR